MKQKKRYKKNETLVGCGARVLGLRTGYMEQERELGAGYLGPRSGSFQPPAC